MFYKNKIKTLKTKEKEFAFDYFSICPNLQIDENMLEEGYAITTYNFITEDKTLKSGYGFKDVQMPTSSSNLDDESKVTLRGNEVKAIWKLKWYNINTDTDNYYLFYFNDENLICYDNMFSIRPATLIIPNDYTETPYVVYYRQDGSDCLLLSGEGGGLTIISGSSSQSSDTAPLIISCCSHYGMMFAITADARGKLIYSEDTDILEWTDEKTKDLDFSDERGDLNKLMSFNDYIYIFRDYGITKVSVYSSDDEFSISHMYLADNYIYPNSISQSGDNIYFLEDSGIKVFNGSSVKNINLDCINLLKNCDNRNCYGVCFKGKYYLACRANFNDGKEIGCEKSELGYKNNTLIIYDIESNHVDIVRGVDINQMLAFINPYKSKLFACFNNDYINKIGEITTEGKIFDENEEASFLSGKIDFGLPGIKKKIKYFLIKSIYDCKIEFICEDKTKIIDVKGCDKIQKINANIVGRQFQINILKTEAQANISNFILTVRVPK